MATFGPSTTYARFVAKRTLAMPLTCMAQPSECAPAGGASTAFAFLDVSVHDAVIFPHGLLPQGNINYIAPSLERFRALRLPLPIRRAFSFYHDADGPSSERLNSTCPFHLRPKSNGVGHQKLGRTGIPRVGRDEIRIPQASKPGKSEAPHDILPPPLLYGRGWRR